MIGYDKVGWGRMDCSLLRNESQVAEVAVLKVVWLRLFPSPSRDVKSELHPH